MSDEYSNLGGFSGLGGLNDTGLGDSSDSFESSMEESLEGGLQGFDKNIGKSQYEDTLFEGGLSELDAVLVEPEYDEPDMLEGLENGLTGLDDGLSGETLSSNAGSSARDAVNMMNQDNYGFGDTPQSLSDFDTAGIGSGLSAVKESLGAEGGIELSAALADEDEEEPVRAALADEDEEDPILAGRSDPAPINAGFGKPQQAVGGGQEDVDVAFHDIDNYGIANPQKNLASKPSQNIDDIFIAGNFSNRTAGATTSATGGTMYNPNEEHANVHVSFGLPPIVKKLLVLAGLLAAIYCILEYGFHMKVENYIHPVDVQKYYATSVETVSSELNLDFTQVEETYTSSEYDYTYNVDKAGGLKLVNYNGGRMYVQVTGVRIDFSIYGIRPQLTKYVDALNLLTQAGFEKIDTYEETEELGSMGQEHVFYNQKTGEGIIIGKKSQYDSVKSVKYTQQYKNYNKIRSKLRNEAAN